MKLREDWKQAYRWLSMQGMTVAATFLVVWALVPEKMQDSFSPTELKLMAVGLIAMSMAGRLVKQKPKA
jgi:hypothetical protein